MRKTKFTSHKRVNLVFSLSKMPKKKTYKTKYTTSFSLCLKKSKETDHKPSNIAAAKSKFCSVCI